MAPLRREWAETRETVICLLATGRKGRARPPVAPVADRGDGRPGGASLPIAARKKARAEADSILHLFLVRLQTVRVLDPACGSGNFLYVTLQKLKDLEKEVIVFAMDHGLTGYLPLVGPWQLYGIEINPCAHDLARSSVWIGFLQWTRANRFQITQDPVLRPMKSNFRCMDSILDLSEPDHPKEPDWPRVDYIVRNPPFLGDKIMRSQLGDEYATQLRAHYSGRIPGQSDLCCYWFEKARAHIVDGKYKRAGLLATQGIRGGANREVLKRIKDVGGIFWTESDRPWILDGANVHVSLIAFDSGTEKSRILDGRSVVSINSNLSTAADVTTASILCQNTNVSFLGSCKGGPFDIVATEAMEMLLSSGNPHGRPNSDVLRPVANSEDLLRTRSLCRIVDSACETVDSFSLYESPSNSL